MNKTQYDQLAGKTYCNRCGHEMWYYEKKKRWYCTNPNCVKYKPQTNVIVKE